VKVLCVAGMPGCGKEEFLRVAAEHGFTIVRMGDVVREEATKRGIGTSDEAIGGFAHSERERSGFGITGERVVIDGLRGFMELDVFRKHLGESIQVVAIHAAPKVRFERLRARNRSDAPTTWEEFRVRDIRELRWGLGDVIATADYMIVNEGELGSFRARAREVMESVLGGASHVP